MIACQSTMIKIIWTEMELINYVEMHKRKLPVKTTSMISYWHIKITSNIIHFYSCEILVRMIKTGLHWFPMTHVITNCIELVHQLIPGSMCVEWNKVFSPGHCISECTGKCYKASVICHGNLALTQSIRWIVCYDSAWCHQYEYLILML